MKLLEIPNGTIVELSQDSCDYLQVGDTPVNLIREFETNELLDDENSVGFRILSGETCSMLSHYSVGNTVFMNFKDFIIKE